MKKIIVIIILIVSYVATICAEKVKIGDLYYELDDSSLTAEVAEQEHFGLEGTIDIPPYITNKGKRYVVTKIGESAFRWCYLTAITIPNSVISIGNEAFSECQYLTTITIPNNVTSIGYRAFDFNMMLKSITIPQSVRTIGDEAFIGCDSLSAINVAPDNPFYCSIDGVLFDKKRTTLIKYPKKKQGIYIIPDGITNIGNGAFESCTGLTSVTIPSSVTSIGERAFADCCGLTSITLPISVMHVGVNAFSWGGIDSINVVPDNPYYCSIDGVLFDKKRTTLIKYPKKKQGIYIIPDGITNIGNGAFESCTGLTSVTIPSSVTSIGERAFADCCGLTSINIPYGITSIDSHTFSGCSNLTSVTIPNSITSIARGAFSGCSGLTYVVIPNSVTHIEYDAFDEVLSIAYSGAATGYPWGARFTNCYVEGKYIYSDETKKTLIACSSALQGNLTIPDGVVKIGDKAFKYCVNLTSVTIPNSVTSIGKNIFAYPSSIIDSITIPNSVTRIEEIAFRNVGNVIYSGVASGAPWGAKYLNGYAEGEFVYSDRTKKNLVSWISSLSTYRNAEIPNCVTSIGDRAFVGENLNSVTIPESVQYIGKYLFYECGESFKSVTWNAINCSTYDDGQYVYPPFQDCENITSFTIGENVEALPRGLCYGLPITHIAIPPKVRYIGTSAFRECKKLTSVIIVGDVQFGSSVFEDCPNVIVYTTNPTMSIPGVPAERVKKVTYQQLYDYPFSIFAKSFVEEEVNKWQQKGEYERISDWQKRVNEQARQQKINELLADAEQKYVEHWQPQTQLSLQLGKYDADNEVYALHDVQYGDAYMPVPIRDAKSFKENWEDKQFTYSLQIRDDQFKLASVSITMPNGKEYICHATDDVNYNIADIEYNFSPIDLNIASSNGSQGRPNISTRKIKAGISDVDTNIPETEAYNPNTFVVIFANEDYRYVASVPYAKNDGKIFQQYCEKTLGIPADNIHHVENASLNDIRYHLAWLNKVCDAYNGNASLIIYYAGHGIPDETNKTAYILPSDGNSTYVQSAYKLDDFYQRLGAMSAKSVTVFMDACFSGSKREEGMLASARGVAIKAKNGLPQGNMVVFSAATGDETAYPNNEEHHGMFTYYLLKKLQETEGDVTLKDLGNYITTNVRQQSIVKNGKSQTPTITPSVTLTADWQNWKLK